jgi:hypothetical protein
MTHLPRPTPTSNSLGLRKNPSPSVPRSSPQPPYFAASLGYLNDAHFPGHHRDGVTAEAWLPIVPLSNRLTLSVGGGPFYYYDTVFARNSGGYADAHAWAWLASLDATIQPWKSGWWSHLFLRANRLYVSVEEHRDYILWHRD